MKVLCPVSPFLVLHLALSGPQALAETTESNEQFEFPFEYANELYKNTDLQNMLKENAGGLFVVLKTLFDASVTKSRSGASKVVTSLSTKLAETEAAMKTFTAAQSNDPAGYHAKLDTVKKSIHGVWSAMHTCSEQEYCELATTWEHLEKEYSSISDQLKQGTETVVVLPDGKLEQAIKTGKDKVGGHLSTFQKTVNNQAMLTSAMGGLALYHAMKEAMAAYTEMTEYAAHEPSLVKQITDLKAELQAFTERVAERFRRNDWDKEKIIRASNIGRNRLAKLEKFLQEQTFVKTTANSRESKAWSDMVSNALSTVSAVYSVYSWSDAGLMVPVLQKVAIGAYTFATGANVYTARTAQETSSRANTHIQSMGEAQKQLDRVLAELDKLMDDPTDF